MEAEVRDWSLGELALFLGGELVGPAASRIQGPSPAGSGDATCLTFAGDDRHLALAESSDVGAVLVGLDATSTKPHIRVQNPKEAFGRFLGLCVRELPMRPGIDPGASVSPAAKVDPSASIGAFAVVERGAVVGAGARVYPFCYVGEGCVLGDHAVLFPHVVLYQDVRIGDRTVIHAGTVLGADGFGYIWNGSQQAKVPQVGGVVIGPDCEIGALTAIDRGMIGDTIIRAGVKVDNLVQLGHNSELGEHSVVASQTGIAGSTQIGSRVLMGGKVGIGDHVSITDDVMLAAGSATTIDIENPGAYKGFPVRPIVTQQRIEALVGRLPETAKKMRDLERRIAELESKLQ